MELDAGLVRSGRLLAIGLAHGLCTRDGATAWADAWMLRLDAPPAGLWDVSMPGFVALQDVINSIDAVVGPASTPDAFGAAVALLHRAHARGTLTLVQAAHRLYYLRPDDLPRELDRAVFQLDHEAELVDMDAGDPTELANRFETFAGPFVDAWSDVLALVP